MAEVSLSNLAVVLGLLFCVPSIYGLLRPAAFATMARKFPRCTPAGYVLMAAGTAWFVYLVSQERVADFAAFKPALYSLFILVGLGACVFVRDYLAVRGLAVVLLLMAKLMVDTGRPHLGETSWTLVVQTLAYVWVISGMWLTISPWRYRDAIHWATLNEQRTRLLSGIRLGLGILLIALAFTAFKPLKDQALARTFHTYSSTEPVDLEDQPCPG